MKKVYLIFLTFYTLNLICSNGKITDYGKPCSNDSDCQFKCTVGPSGNRYCSDHGKSCSTFRDCTASCNTNPNGKKVCGMMSYCSGQRDSICRQNCERRYPTEQCNISCKWNSNENFLNWDCAKE